MEEQKPYNPVIDALRILAILGVVLIHTSTRPISASHLDVAHLPVTLFLNQAVRFAVPLFFMISGFVLELSYKYHTSYVMYLKKRFLKIVIPYIFWSAIYYIFVFPHNATPFYQTLLAGSASYQLYFIPTLLIFYLIFPLMHRYLRILSSLPILLILVGSELFLLFYDYYLQPLELFPPIKFAVLNFALFLLGAVAYHHKDKIRSLGNKWVRTLMFLTIALGLFVFFEGKYRYEQTHNYLSIYSQWRPSIFFYTVTLACSLYYLLSKAVQKTPWIKKVSELSFFVFFIHVIIIELFWTSVFLPLYRTTSATSAEQFWYDPLFFAVIAGISFACGYIVHKIPYAAKLTG